MYSNFNIGDRYMTNNLLRRLTFKTKRKTKLVNIIYCTLLYFRACVLIYETKVKYKRGHRGRGRMVVWFTAQVHTVHITNNVVSSNPAHGEVYSMQHYVKMLVSDFRQVGGYILVLGFYTPIKVRVKYEIIWQQFRHYVLTYKKYWAQTISAMYLY